MSNEKSISLNKYISSSGLYSRRNADLLIEEGRVKINGKLAIKGNRVYPQDIVTLDNKIVNPTPKEIYMAFHKLPGITCTTDRKDKDNIIDFINYPERIFPIGRLDKASSGLILLTNNGDIVNKILRRENKHEKEYIVKVNKPLTQEFVAKMENGIPILGTITDPCKVEILNKNIFRIILTQGLNRQIRRMCKYLGYQVVTLKRTRIMFLELNHLKPGHWRLLNSHEIKKLMKIKNSDKI